MAYTRPMRNPLRRSLTGYRRGLGDTPIDIGTSATVDVTPTGTAVIGQGASAGYSAITPTGSGSLTDWLNQNSSTLLWVGGIAIGVLFLSKVAK